MATARRRARRKARRRYLAVISLVKELGTGGGGGGEGGDGGDGGDGEDGNGEDGGDGGEGPDVGGGDGDEWPPIGWEDPPGIFPPLTPSNPIVKLEDEGAPPAGAVWPHLPVKRGHFAALVDAGEHGHYVVALDASVRWPEEDEGEEGEEGPDAAGRRR